MKPWIIIFFIYICIANASAQNQPIIDSLNKQLKTERSDTGKVWVMLALAFEYRQADNKQAQKLTTEAITLAEKVNFKAGLALAYNHMGIVYKYQSNSDKSIEWHLKSLALKRKLNDRDGMASSYNNLGNSYMIKKDYVHAMEYLLKYLKICEEDKYIKGVGAAYDNIAGLYAAKNEIDKALEFSNKSLTIRRQEHDTAALGRHLSGIAFLYYEKNNYTKALQCYEEALHIFKLTGDAYNAAEIYAVIGNILVEQGKLDEGIAYQEKGLLLTQETQNQPGEVSSYISLGQTWGYKKNYIKGIEYTKKGIAIAKEIRHTEAMKDGYEVLTELYKKKGDFQLALESHYTFMQLKDSVIQQSNAEVMEDLKSKYESDKKDIQIKETNLELTNTQLIADRRKVYSLILAFTILFTIVIAYLIYNRTRLKQQRQLDAELIKQQDLRGRAVLEAEEKERIRIARDLHDGVGQLLSAARMQVSGLDHLVKDANESNKSSFQNALKLLDDSVKEVRGVSHSMIPNALLRSGLVAAVREFVDRLSNERMKIDLQIVGLQERLEPQMETVLYRVLQEIVSNTVKYSQAQNLSIQLIRHEQEITLMVEDNGKGFNVAEVMNSEKAGIGIKNIISRVNYLNGEVIFDSSPNNGTTITVEIPIG